MSGALLAASMVKLGKVLTGDDIPASMTDLGGATTTYGSELEFNTLGGIFQRRDVGSNVSEGDWVIPASAAATDDAVKYTYSSGDNTHNIGNLSSGVYSAISTTRDHGLRYTSSGGSDDISQVVDWHIAEDTGGTGEIGPFSTTITVGEIF